MRSSDRRPRKTDIRHGECKEELCKIFDEVYHYDDNYPKKQDYAEAYAEYKTKKDKMPKGKEYDAERFRATVSRVIDSFVQDGIMKEAAPKRYVPNNDKYKRYLIKLAIWDKVYFSRPDILKINERAVVIALKNGDEFEGNLSNGKQLIQNYLKDSCYSISILDDALLVFLCDNERISCEELTDIVKKGYQLQNNTKKKRN